MIIGDTYSDKEAAEQLRLSRLDGVRFKKFAWWPIATNQGQRVWLQEYWLEYCVYKRTTSMYRGPYYTNGGSTAYIFETGNL